MTFWSGRMGSALASALFVLSGCGDSQNQSLAPSTLSSSFGSHVAKSATAGDLIYATSACGGTCIFSYPSGQLVGSLSHIGNAGICSDSSGNVYIPDQNTLVEYAHGGTSPINTFTLSEGEINSCAIDPGTGGVAVAGVLSTAFNVAVFTSPSSPPTTYFVDADVQYCGYDGSGNLFVDGYGHDFALYELSKGSNAFSEISVDHSLDVRPGQVQWDGTYLTVEGVGVQKGVSVYRLSVTGSAATVVGTTKFKGVSRTASQSWIQGNIILIPYGTRGNGAMKNKVGIWNYPSGGKTVQKISHFDKEANLQAVTLSVP